MSATENPDSAARAELEALRLEAAALRRQLAQSPEQVRELESRVDSLSIRNSKLMDTLREARQQLIALREEVDRLGQPPVAAVVSLFHHLANIFQEQNQPPPSGGIRVAVDRKLLRKIKAKKIAQGHKADDHEPEMQL